MHTQDFKNKFFFKTQQYNCTTRAHPPPPFFFISTQRHVPRAQAGDTLSLRFVHTPPPPSSNTTRNAAAHNCTPFFNPPLPTHKPSVLARAHTMKRRERRKQERAFAFFSGTGGAGVRFFPPAPLLVFALCPSAPQGTPNVNTTPPFSCGARSNSAPTFWVFLPHNTHTHTRRGSPPPPTFSTHLFPPSPPPAKNEDTPFFLFSHTTGDGAGGRPERAVRTACVSLSLRTGATLSPPRHSSFPAGGKKHTRALPRPLCRARPRTPATPPSA